MTTALGRTAGIECHDHLAQIARALVLLKPPQIIEAIYGTVPDGLPGTLRRIGPDPFIRQRMYRDLFRLFAEPDDSRRADLVRQTPGKLTESRLEGRAVVIHSGRFAAGSG